MKKSILLVALAALVAGSASAQIKGADALKKITSSASVEQLTSLINEVKPQLSNSKDGVLWYAAGKAQFALYDQLQVAKSVKKQEVSDQDLSNALMTGYDYLQQALALHVDTVLQYEKDGSPKMDKKTGTQKFKVMKYSSEINDLLKGHVGDFGTVANNLFNSQSYGAAGTAFGLYGDLVKQVNPQIADSVIAEIKFFEGYSQYGNKEYAKSLKSLSEAKKLGYTANSIDAFLQSSIANRLQEFVEKKDFADGYAMIDKYLAEQPGNGMLYYFKGFLTEADSTKTDALAEAQALYVQGAEVDPTCAEVYFDAGRTFWQQAQNLIINNPNATNAQLGPKVLPLLNQALPYLQKAKELDTKGTIKNIQVLLDDIDYKLGLLNAKK